MDYSFNEWAAVNSDDNKSIAPLQSIHILSTVISRSKTRNVSVIDAGLKAISYDSGSPYLILDGVRQSINVKSHQGGGRYATISFRNVS